MGPRRDYRVALPRLAFRVAWDESGAHLRVTVERDELVVGVWSGAPLGRDLARVETTEARTEVAGGQTVRRNTLVRHMVVGGAGVSDVVATNAKRLLAPTDMARNCLTCDAHGCAGRVEIS